MREQVPEWVRTGKMISGVEFLVTSATRTKTIQHGLGRPLRGWFFARFRRVGTLGGGLQVFFEETASDSDKLTIRLSTTATASDFKYVADVWVF